MAKSLKDYIQALPRESIVGQICELIELGFPKDEIKEALPILLDDLVMFDRIVPGPGGILLEASDRAIFSALVSVLFPLWYRKAEAQADKGAPKVVARVRESSAE